jgi:hypothetical protein
MCSRQAGYQETIRGLLTRVPTFSPRTTEFEPSEKLRASFGALSRSASGTSLPGGNRAMAAGSINLDSLASYGPLAFAPEEATVTEPHEHDRGALRPARGIVISILLGIALWGLSLGVLVAVVR